IYDVRLDLRASSRLLVVGDIHVPRLTIRYDALPGSARLTIDATPRATSTVSQENERLFIRFDAEALDLPSPLMAPLPAQSLVTAVRVMEPSTLVFDLSPRFAGFRAAMQPIETTARTVIDLAGATTEPAPPAPGATAAPTELPPALVPAA